jgi:hypothetical protein
MVSIPASWGSSVFAGAAARRAHKDCTEERSNAPGHRPAVLFDLVWLIPTKGRTLGNIPVVSPPRGAARASRPTTLLTQPLAPTAQPQTGRPTPRGPGSRRSRGAAPPLARPRRGAYPRPRRVSGGHGRPGGRRPRRALKSDRPGPRRPIRLRRGTPARRRPAAPLRCPGRSGLLFELGSPAASVWLFAPCRFDDLGGVAAGVVGCPGPLIGTCSSVRARS